MRDDRAEASANDGWVSFSDILLTLVCALLYIRTLVASQNTGVSKTREFEQRLQTVERFASEIDGAVKQTAMKLQQTLGPARAGRPAE